MGVLGNIYCIPQAPGSVAWSGILQRVAERALVRLPCRAGSPFAIDSPRSGIAWPENWIVPETLPKSTSNLPFRDFTSFDEALAYVADAADATVTMDAPQSSFQIYPDERELSAAFALYRFRGGAPFRVGVPEDFSDLIDEFPDLADQPSEPRWQGVVKELIWIHGKCVPPEAEFRGSPIHKVLESIWPGHLLLADEFL